MTPELLLKAAAGLRRTESTEVAPEVLCEVADRLTAKAQEMQDARAQATQEYWANLTPDLDAQPHFRVAA